MKKQRDRSREMSDRQQKRDLKAAKDAWQYGDVTSSKTIEGAAKKPKGVSDVRWRMELRRRANPSYYSLAGDFV